MAALLHSLTAMRGVAIMVERHPERLSAEQLAQLLALVSVESARAIEIVRRALLAHGDEGDDLLFDLVGWEQPGP